MAHRERSDSRIIKLKEIQKTSPYLPPLQGYIRAHMHIIRLSSAPHYVKIKYISHILYYGNENYITYNVKWNKISYAATFFLASNDWQLTFTTHSVLFQQIMTWLMCVAKQSHLDAVDHTEVGWSTNEEFSWYRVLTISHYISRKSVDSRYMNYVTILIQSW